MKNMNVTLNDKGIVAVMGTILILTLLLGGMFGFKAKELSSSSKTAEFTVEEAYILVDLQQQENAKESGMTVTGYHDGNGKFVVSWENGSYENGIEAVTAKYSD